MSLSDILEKIVADADDIAEEKRRVASDRVVEIEKTADHEIAKIESRFALQKAEKVEKIQHKAHSLAMAHRKMALSEAKQKVLSKIFHEVKIAFSRLSDGERELMYSTLLIKIPKGEGVVFPARGETVVLTRATKKAGRDFTIGAEMNDELGGFLFSSPLLDADARLSVLLQKEVFPQIEKELSEILFSA